MSHGFYGFIDGIFPTSGQSEQTKVRAEACRYLDNARKDLAMLQCFPSMKAAFVQ